MELAKIYQLMREKGCQRILVKKLAENDNSKQQIYFGPGFEAVNLFPNLTIKAGGVGLKGPIFKANLSFSWVNTVGNLCQAPHAKIILYPQYPEIRFSGFLLGCQEGPSNLMQPKPRIRNRVLVLGIKETGEVLGFVAPPEAGYIEQIEKLPNKIPQGVFLDITDSYDSELGDSRNLLLAELLRIHNLGWLDSKRLNSLGNIMPCNSPNSGGYTLEAELGITPNGISDPDYRGWEIKQHTVNNFERLESGVLTLMTPEPTGGVYVTKGVKSFIHIYGYRDKQGREDRLNFGGIHRVGQQHKQTGLVLKLNGYDSTKGKIVSDSGAIALVDNKGSIAASWDFANLMNHWNRKHNKAVYVPSKLRKIPQRQYHYGYLVRLGEGTDFLNFLKALAEGALYYDPGLKLENASKPKPRIKRRNQFRIRSASLHMLYKSFETVDVRRAGNSKA